MPRGEGLENPAIKVLREEPASRGGSSVEGENGFRTTVLWELLLGEVDKEEVIEGSVETSNRMGGGPGGLQRTCQG